jgi:hypothetical protein
MDDHETQLGPSGQIGRLGKRVLAVVGVVNTDY